MHINCANTENSNAWVHFVVI